MKEMEEIEKEMRKMDLYNLVGKYCYQFGRYRTYIFLYPTSRKPELKISTGIIKGIRNIKKYIILNELEFKD